MPDETAAVPVCAAHSMPHTYDECQLDEALRHLRALVDASVSQISSKALDRAWETVLVCTACNHSWLVTESVGHTPDCPVAAAAAFLEGRADDA